VLITEREMRDPHYWLILSDSDTRPRS